MMARIKVLEDTELKLGKGSLHSSAVTDVDKMYELQLENGWSDVAGYGPSRAIKMGNFVTIFGLVTGGNSDIIFTLPPDIRPKYTSRSSALYGSYTTYAVIRPTGVVTVTDAANKGNVSIGDLSYYLE